MTKPRELSKKDLLVLYKQAAVMLNVFETQRNSNGNANMNIQWGITAAQNFVEAFEWLLGGDEEEEGKEKDNDAP